jgi:hypothetical protein
MCTNLCRNADALKNSTDSAGARPLEGPRWVTLRIDLISLGRGYSIFHNGSNYLSSQHGLVLFLL